MFKHKLFAGGIGISMLLFLGVSFTETLFIPQAYAAPFDASMGEVGNVIALAMSYLVVFLHSLALFALGIVEYFFRPEFLNNSDMIGPDGTLRRVWFIARDIVNFLFALMLIGVAFYTIIMGSSAKIKEYLARFVLAVILVNFSWFFPRVILDISNILTSTVLSLPSTVFQDVECQVPGDNPGDPPEPCTIITAVKIFPDPVTEVPTLPQPPWKCYSLVCYLEEPFDSAAGNHAVLGALAVNFGRIASLVEVPSINAGPAGAGAGSTVQYKYIFNLAFALIFIVALAFPLLALAAGLIIRIIILWACIAFMPFTFINFVLSGSLNGNIPGMGDETNIWKHFITAAFLPLLVAIPITIGFIMINAGSTGAGIAFDTFPIQIDSTVPLVTGIDSISDFIWAFMALIVIWMGAFGALRRNAIIGKVTDKIQAAGQSVGSMALKAPLLTPIPLPKGGSISAGQALMMMKRAPAAMDASVFEGKDFSDGLMGRHTSSAQTNSIASSLSQNTVALDKIAKELGKGKDADMKEIRRVIGEASGVNVSNMSDGSVVDILSQTNSQTNKFDQAQLNALRNRSGGTQPSTPPATTPSTPSAPLPPVQVTQNQNGEIVINNQTVTQQELTNSQTGDDIISNIYTRFNIPANSSSDEARRLAAQGFTDLKNQNIAGDLSAKAENIARELANPQNAQKTVEDIIRDTVDTPQNP